MRITDPKQLSDGMIIWVTCAFVNKESITRVTKFEVVKARIDPPDGQKHWCRIRHLGETYKFNHDTNDFEVDTDAGVLDGHADDRSMRDMGIVYNTYNKHQTFDDVDDAKNYVFDLFGVRRSQAALYADFDRAMPDF